ncbi:MAG: type II toxin-antitoxin system HicA family toxin [Chloroflexi bacterium]|nr:type II toxin-antitoxin system HicA family toxin [Chloroflexota bacterium]
MSKLRVVPYRDLSNVVERAGFHWVRTEGSHNTFRNSEGRIVVIPDHGSQVIVRPLLRKVLRDTGMTVEEYHKLLDNV